MGKPLMEIPGDSSATVHLVDSTGRLINTIKFSTGWRIDLLTASFKYDPELQGYLIDVRSMDVINGEDIARQVYGIIDQRLALLWLEDSRGKTIPHPCQHGVGPKQPQRTANEWEASLSSDQPLVVFEALAFLAGGASYISHNQGTSMTLLHYDDEEVATIELTLNRPNVREKIEELTKSCIPRVGTAARQILDFSTSKLSP